MKKLEIVALAIVGVEMIGMHILGNAFRKEATRRAQKYGFDNPEDLIKNGRFDENGNLVRIKGR